MYTVQITNWKVGFNKAQFNKKLRAHYGFDIARSKKIVDDILNNKKVTLSFKNEEEAKKFFNDVKLSYKLELLK